MKLTLRVAELACSCGESLLVRLLLLSLSLLLLSSSSVDPPAELETPACTSQKQPASPRRPHGDMDTFAAKSAQSEAIARARLRMQRKKQGQPRARCSAAQPWGDAHVDARATVVLKCDTMYEACTNALI